MSNRPPPKALQRAIRDGTVSVLRRMAFFEADNTTIWVPEGGDPDVGVGLPSSRLLGGNVTVDYDREERRAFDMTLDNRDSLIDPEPDKLWYDKIVKCYRGYLYPMDTQPPDILIVEEDAAGQGFALKQILNQLGYTTVDVNVNAANLGDVSGYEIIVSYTRTAGTSKAQLLKNAYDAGIHVITIGNANGTSVFPFVTSASAVTTPSTAWNYTPSTWDTPIKGGWSAETVALDAGTGLRTLSGAAQAVATATDSVGTHYPIVIAENEIGGRWFVFQPHTLGTQGKIVLSNALKWMWDRSSHATWETQIGEFLIDKIDWQTFPGKVQLTGRDFTKKALGSKITDPSGVGFVAGTSIELIVSAVASNAGLTKQRLKFREDTATGDSLSLEEDYVAAQETSRWKIIKDICTQYGYELFMSSDGYLTSRPFIDPTLGPIAYEFYPGQGGNLISLKKSTDDSLIVNKVVVTGSIPKNGILPFYGEASNVEPSSPTAVQLIGERPQFLKGNNYTSNKHCRNTAVRFLKIGALEPFNMELDALTQPWLEAGEIARVTDSEPVAGQPDKFLLTSFSIALDLAPMSTTCRRVKIVTSDVEMIDEFADDEGVVDPNEGQVILPPGAPGTPTSDTPNFNLSSTRNSNSAPFVSPGKL